MNAIPRNQQIATDVVRPYCVILEFTALQILDVLTTLACMSVGGMEGNPLVNLFITATAHPVIGLIAVKTIAIAMGLFCHATGRLRVLQRANRFFWILVGWNIVVMTVCLFSDNMHRI